MGFDANLDPYHITLVREKLSRNMGSLVLAVVDELELAMKEYIPSRGDGADSADCSFAGR